MVQIGMIARLGADATSEELAAQGLFAVKFNACVNVQRKDQEGKYYDIPQWWRVTYFSRSTAILPYLTKGMQVYLHGEPVVDSYISKTTGAQMVSASVVAHKIELLGRKEAENETV